MTGSSKIDFGVFMGRMRPVTRAHEDIIRGAVEQVETLFVLVGSANRPRSYVTSAFSYEEVCAMLELVFKHEITTGRIVLLPMPDYVYDEQGWIASTKAIVHDAIRKATSVGDEGRDPESYRIALAGYGKDASSFYLERFPEWESIQVGRSYALLSATHVREAYFQRVPQTSDFGLSRRIVEYLHEFMHTDEFVYVVREREAIERNISTYGKGPFNAADAIVTWRDQILLIERRGAVGFGLDAFPGGMLEYGETTLECAIRETNEETGILDLNPGFEQILRGSLASYRLFDAPGRDPRGHYMSHAYHFELPDDFDAPGLNIAPRSDAGKTGWKRMEDWGHGRAFLDHFGILRCFKPALENN